MNFVTAAVVSLALAQEPDAPVPEAASPAAEGAEVPAVAASPGPAAAPRPKGADEVQRLIQKLSSLSAPERAQAIEALQKQFGGVDTNPVLPSADVDLDKYLELTPPQQIEVNVRAFVGDVVTGDLTRLISRAGYPFYLEGRRVDRPEDLRTLWGKALRSRRADLVKLYSVEVLSPADMEKKYGKPPQRLSSWNWKAPNTFVAVANLSGHAAVVLVRQAGAAWQIVGFHD